MFSRTGQVPYKISGVLKNGHQVLPICSDADLVTQHLLSLSDCLPTSVGNVTRKESSTGSTQDSPLNSEGVRLGFNESGPRSKGSL